MNMNRLLPCTLILVLAGCDKLSDRVTSGVVVLIGDSPRNDLSSLRLRVTAIDLLDGDHAESLLSEPVQIELIHLDLLRALLTIVEIPRGGYDRLRVSIDPTSVLARDRFGLPTKVDVVRSSETFTLKNDVDVERNQVTHVRIDVLLNESLHERKDGFDFELAIEAAGTTGEVELAEVRGRVVEIERAFEHFSMDILASEEGLHSRGLIEVDVGDGVLLDEKGNVVHTDDFLDHLGDGDVVEVHGRLNREHVLAADAVEIQSTG